MDSNNEILITESQLLLTETIRRLLSDSRQQLLSDIRLILSDKKPQERKWLKSSEVKKLLGISHGTLQTLRNKGIIPFTKIGGVMYYSRNAIDKVLDSGHSLSLKNL